jgi:GNAT superfamily N-acetyltransferase
MTRGPYEISADPARLDLEAIHAYLTRSYWSPGIPREVVERAAAHSLCFGLYHASEGQVGYARVVTDRASFAYLCDVYVLEAHRGQGLSKWLLDTILQHPELQGLRRFMLATKDAHGLYAQFGFTPLANPARMMEILRPDAYQRPASGSPQSKP